MEQTTLQQRIEERAHKRLLNLLHNIAIKEEEIANTLGKENYEQRLHVTSHYYQHMGGYDISLVNDFAKDLFKKLLPNYIRLVTDELLQKIDAIEDFLNNKPPDDF